MYGVAALKKEVPRCKLKIAAATVARRQANPLSGALKILGKSIPTHTHHTQLEQPGDMVQRGFILMVITSRASSAF